MAINIERRKKVMARSKKLGHCVCNPRQPCPCDTLKQYNVCPCAGERMPVKEQAVALTRHVRKAGCASKIGQADLLRILENLPPVTDPNVLVGSAAGDDAGVYRIDDRFSLVQSVDVFTPSVDDPHLFGQIAAANSVSDIYAMGGTPLTALSIIGFPIDQLDGRVMEALLRGGIEKLQEASCSVIGGHSINDEEVKCGFAVTGIIDSEKTVSRNSAQAGDVLVLTKPLGTGMISFAAQLGRASETALREIGLSMAELNNDAAELMLACGAHACTDITGYALAGHLVEMARNSGVAAEIDLSKVPVFAAAKICLEHEILGGAIERNQEYSMAWIRSPDASPYLPIIYDPQTSGGLLVALPEKKASAFVKEMHKRGHPHTAIIGKVVETGKDSPEGTVSVISTDLRHLTGSSTDVISTSPGASAAPKLQQKKQAQPSAPPAEEEPCCENPPVFDDDEAEEEKAPSAPPAPRSEPAASSGAEDLFKQFMQAANRGGAVDTRAKKLIAIALSISGHCDPCLKSHLKSAVEMGISKEEIDEAATLAIEFSGCPALMFYNEVCRKMKL